MILFYIVVCTLIAGVGSVLVAGFLTFSFFSNLVIICLFCSWNFLATAFYLLPAFELSSESLMVWLLIGLVLFFILNKADLYHHGHEHGSNFEYDNIKLHFRKIMIKP